MAALANEISRAIGERIQAGVLAKASAVIYRGAYLCKEDADGYARSCAASLTNPSFLGISDQNLDMTGKASGAASVIVFSEGLQRVAAIAGAAGVADIDKPVYASTDNDLTLTSTNNVPVGTIANFIDGFFYVRFQAKGRRSL